MAELPPILPQDRRTLPRFDGSTLHVCLRRRGRFKRFVAEVVDFNRHGLAVRFERPLQKDEIVYVDLNAGDIHLHNVIGVVHNCLGKEGTYRCGIRFRPRSGLQFDREAVEDRLRVIEKMIDAG